MITDRHKKFEIIAASSAQIVCLKNNSQKFIYRQFTDLTLEQYTRVASFHEFHHPFLLQLHKFEASSSKQKGITLGLQIEHHCGSLEQYVSSRTEQFDEEDIINTFTPISEAIQYLLSAGWAPTGINLRNVVITEKEEVKYLDDCLLNPKATSSPSISSHQLYGQLSEMIYNLMMISLKTNSVRSWKNRLQILKQKVSKQAHLFFLSLYQKSLAHAVSPKKKKIKKLRKIEGKQNFIQQ